MYETKVLRIFIVDMVMVLWLEHGNVEYTSRIIEVTRKRRFLTGIKSFLRDVTRKGATFVAKRGLIKNAHDSSLPVTPESHSLNTK